MLTPSEIGSKERNSVVDVLSNGLYDSVVSVPSIRLYAFPGSDCHWANKACIPCALVWLAFAGSKSVPVMPGWHGPVHRAVHKW